MSEKVMDVSCKAAAEDIETLAKTLTRYRVKGGIKMVGKEEQHFARGNINIPRDCIFAYRKVSFTPAIRIEGPFSVATLEGTMRCEDGWLAFDTDWNPYPIDHKIFAATYERVEDTHILIPKEVIGTKA